MKNDLKIAADKEYQWRQAWAHPIAHTDINLVVEELEIIQDINGTLTPGLVLESAKNKSSVLHKCFTWDDSIAANKWRLRQASEMLSNIQLKVIKDGEPRFFRAYEVTKANSFKGNSEMEYKKVETLTPENIQFVLKFALKDLVKIKHRLEAFNYDHVVIHINKAIEEIQKEPKQIMATTDSKTELVVV